MYRHILVACDDSTASRAAAGNAVNLARKLNAKVTAVHVMAPYSPHVAGEIRAKSPDPLTPAEYRRLTEKSGRAALATVEAAARDAEVACDTRLVTSEDAHDGIIDAARESECDLIVMGTSARQGLERLFLGSVATEVLNRSRVPVLVCRPAERRATAGA